MLGRDQQALRPDGCRSLFLRKTNLLPGAIEFMSANKSQFAIIGVACDYQEALHEVIDTIGRISASHSPAAIQLGFGLIELAFEGRLPGYQNLQAPYHNRCHTLEVAVCTARLLHGLHASGVVLHPRTIDAAILAALFHDSGYLKADTESGGTGAQFTVEHVRRSVAFVNHGLAAIDGDLRRWIIDGVLATDHRMMPSNWNCACAESELAARVAATADIVGQMASREYLERLLFLYFEFREAGVGGFKDLHELLEKTKSFYEMTRKRLFDHLGGIVDCFALHFEVVGGERRNHYLELVDRNIAYLDSILQEDRERRLSMLKRGGIVGQALEMI